jgi:hypothetical protein
MHGMARGNEAPLTSQPRRDGLQLQGLNTEGGGRNEVEFCSNYALPREKVAAEKLLMGVRHMLGIAPGVWGGQ